MQIQQKRRDIAIFKAMGMSDNRIRNIFLHLGVCITFSASALGLGLAALAGYLLEKYPFIELPDVYYVSYLPARMDPEIFFGSVFGNNVAWISGYLDSSHRRSNRLRCSGFYGRINLRIKKTAVFNCGLQSSFRIN